MMKRLTLLFFVLLCGCTTTRWDYINEVDLEETREIGSDDIRTLPNSLTIADLFRRWGPAAGGKELIYLYRSKIVGINLVVIARPPDTEAFDRNVGSAPVKAMMFHPESREAPIIAWGRMEDAVQGWASPKRQKPE